MLKYAAIKKMQWWSFQVKHTLVNWRGENSSEVFGRSKFKEFKDVLATRYCFLNIHLILRHTSKGAEVGWGNLLCNTGFQAPITSGRSTSSEHIFWFEWSVSRCYWKRGALLSPVVLQSQRCCEGHQTATPQMRKPKQHGPCWVKQWKQIEEKQADITKFTANVYNTFSISTEGGFRAKGL